MGSQRGSCSPSSAPAAASSTRRRRGSGSRGWTRGELEHGTLLDLVHVDDLPATAAAFAAVGRAGEEIAGHEHRCRHGDGGWRRLRWFARSDGAHWYALAGMYANDLHHLVVDWLSVPAGLYFLHVVRSLHRRSATDWNRMRAPRAAPRSPAASASPTALRDPVVLATGD